MISQSGHTSSYYAATANPAPLRPALKGDITCDICIIGAGFTGLSAGLYLAEAGYKVVILEAEKVGWGASGRNAGQMVNGFNKDYLQLKRYGEGTARAIADMSFEGSKIIRERVAKYNISCDLKTGGTFFAAFTSKQLAELEQEKKTWEMLGNDQLRLYAKEEVPKIVGSDLYCGGLLDGYGGHVHPLNLALGQAAAIESLGGQIFENSRATGVKRSEKPAVTTEQGKVSADYVILAGNAYLGKMITELSVRTMPVSTQIVVTEPLKDELANKILPEDHCIEDCNYVLDFYRLTADRRLLFGGGIIYSGIDPANIKARLMPRIYKTFPYLEGIKADFSWGGTMSFTFNRMPHIGRLSDKIYFAHGYSGHGLTTTHLIGRLIGEAIHERSNRFDVFASLRHLPFPGGRMLRVPLTVAGAWYYRTKEKLGL